MTQNLWQKKQKLRHSKDVVDIVQYGSSLTRGSTPNDLDIAVIFHRSTLKEQLEEAQSIKTQLQELTELPIHIRSFDLRSLADRTNFARESILFGKSLLTGDDFSLRFGFKPILQVSYTLKDLKKKDKIRFNYALNGKQGKYGLLKEYGGRIVKPGLVEIDPANEKIFLDEIERITKDYRIRRSLVGLDGKI